MLSNVPLILASASLQRAGLLDQLGLRFMVHSVDLDESCVSHETPRDCVERLACEKAKIAYHQYPGSIVLGGDTMVILDGKCYGKPQNQVDASEMLRSLSGRTHEVITGVAVVCEQGQYSCVQSSEVTFRALTDEEIAWYWATGEPADKAGAYAIQGRAAHFIVRLNGSYSGVMGLPLYETSRLLNMASCKI